MCVWFGCYMGFESGKIARDGFAVSVSVVFGAGAGFSFVSFFMIYFNIYNDNLVYLDC